jgi:hypothetical protein
VGVDLDEGSEPARHALCRGTDRAGDNLDDAGGNDPGLPNHGRVETRLESDLDEAQYLFNQLYAAGVDYEDVVAKLEREGIEKFIASFTELLQGIADKRRQLAAA